ncbi:hypothetical protein AK812_SmicGene3610 [Symbiodinium microadriaticum]|uniref:Uncharacterized protein n=1 Tax=Symbiodinium microadriaticum TaxID=2951 RepID=A0A1Q9EYK5_SYMMI|nr:hypothetical protein AK812_SmicGene3610 [Symbiodinium microadriaticum]
MREGKNDWLDEVPQSALGSEEALQVVKFAFSHQQNLREINCGSGSGVTISAERRTGVNRALRHLSNKLPGCCWTVGQTREERP